MSKKFSIATGKEKNMSGIKKKKKSEISRAGAVTHTEN